ncbi:hypothetical protein STEG23_016162 [Scotinomys teguina]
MSTIVIGGVQNGVGYTIHFDPEPMLKAAVSKVRNKTIHVSSGTSGESQLAFQNQRSSKIDRKYGVGRCFAPLPCDAYVQQRVMSACMMRVMSA